MNPRERCLALIEIRRILDSLWQFVDTDYDRRQVEACLAHIRDIFVRLCVKYDFPIDG